MRKFLIVSFLVVTLGYTQNKQVLYDFAGLPQTLLLNPGAEVSNKFHIGFPLFSQISFQAGFTGFSTYNIFADNGVPINNKIKAAINDFGKAEFFAINQQLEILNGGFRIKNKGYLSFGYYQEFDVLVKIPRDLVDLFYEGNTIINKHYSIKNLAVRAELLGVFHVGLSKKINDKWQIGARFKIYSSVFNINSKLNTGSLITEEGINNIYNHRLNNVNILLQTSGIFIDNNEEVNASYVKKNFLFGGNIGFGFDIGFTHQLKKQWKISGSLQDIGFIYNTKNVESFKIKGNYEVDGLQLNFDPNNPENYWSDLQNDFKKNVVLDTLYKKYISFRPVKVNGAINYYFGRQRLDDCNFINNTNPFVNKVGFHLFSNLSTVHTYFAATLFYERKFYKNLYAKITYTADSYSFTNIGFGLSSQFGIFNMYAIADNLLHLNNVYNTKSISFQLGANFIFK